MFEDRYFNYGVVKADNGIAKVYCGLYDWRAISRCGHIVEAYWSGRSIIVKEAESKDRYYRYTDWNTYDTIYV